MVLRIGREGPGGAAPTSWWCCTGPKAHISSAVHLRWGWVQGSKGQVTLLNIIMDLKKCCNHPFLFESAEVRGTWQQD